MRIKVRVEWVSIETLDVPDNIFHDKDGDVFYDYLADNIGSIVSDPEPVDWEIIG